MSLYVAPRQAIIESVNTLNSTNLEPSDVTFGTPTVASQDVQTTTGKNTSIRITGTGVKWSGTVVLNYDRLDLADLGTLVGNKLKVVGVATTHDLIKYLNFYHGMVMTLADIVDSPVTLDTDGNGSATIVATTGSLGWIGQMTFELSRGDAIVDSALTVTGLAGIDYPTKQSANAQAPLAVYWADFTSEYTMLSGYAVDHVITTADAPLAARMEAIAPSNDNNNGWKVTTTADIWARRNLYNGKVIYNGLNSPELTTNPAYKYVMMIQLSDGTGAHGVVGRSNTWFVGAVILHYNNPDDLNNI